MTAPLTGKRVAILATDGFENLELTVPREALERAGATVEVIAPHSGLIQAMERSVPTYRLPVDHSVAEVRPADYDGLVLPGGVANADHLRTDAPSVAFARSFLVRGMPIGVICHGPWILIETRLIKGRTLTSYPSLRTDLENAGAHWVDEEVHNERGLISSRNIPDLPAFCAELVAELSLSRRRLMVA